MKNHPVKNMLTHVSAGTDLEYIISSVASMGRACIEAANAYQGRLRYPLVATVCVVGFSSDVFFALLPIQWIVSTLMSVVAVVQQ